jgi:sec-independent protein translocase protein TatA
LFLPRPGPSFGPEKQWRADRANPIDPEDFRMGSLSIWHWIVVAVIVLLLFGRGKISELMGDVAQGIKAFKKGMSEDKADTDATKDAPVKTIDHTPAPGAAAGVSPDLKARSETEKRFGSGTV